MGYDSPCHGCVAPKRYPGGHDRCKEYKDWKACEQVKKDAERKRKEDEAAKEAASADKDTDDKQ